MADRYWVGGTGTWSFSGTTNWSTTSGGAGGASAPTSVDDVYFDAGSDVGANFTVTMNFSPSCRNFTAGGLDFVMTFAGSVNFTVGGSLTFPATNFIRAYTGLTTFNATTTGHTITTNGVSFGTQVLFQSSTNIGGGWTLGSALNSTSTILYLYTGTLDTAGFTVTASAISSPTSFTRTLILGSSTVALSGISSSSVIEFTSSGLVVNAGTSTINITNTFSTGFFGASQTFYNVNYTSTNLALGSTIAITGSNTFNNLSFATKTVTGICPISFSSLSVTTINGTLTLGSGTTGVARIFVNSSGAAATLSVASLASMSDIDFRFITVTGAAAPISGTRIGDCLGNSGITFSAPRVVYWVSSSSANWSGAVWSTVSGNTGGSTTAFPLAQDFIFINNSGLSTFGTITVDNQWNIPDLSFATRTTVATFATGSNNLSLYGGLTLSAATSTSGTGFLSFIKQNGIAVITSAGRTFPQVIQINAINGTVRINGSLTTSNTIYLSVGTLDMTNGGASNFYGITCFSFDLSGSFSRSIIASFQEILLTGTGTIWSGSNLTNFSLTNSLTAGSSVNTTSTRTLAHGSNGTGNAANAISFRISAGQGNLDLTSGSHYRSLQLGNFTGTIFNRTLTFHGGWSINQSVSLSTGSLVTTFAGTGSNFISTAGKLIPFPMVFNGVGGTWTLQNTLNMPSYALTLTNGTLNTAGFAVTATSILSTGVGARTLTLGASVVTLSGSTPLDITPSLVLNQGTSTITCTGLSVSFTGFDKTFYDVNFTNTGNRLVLVTGANTFNNLNFTARISTGINTIVFPPNVTNTINGTLTLGSGTTGVNRLFVSAGRVEFLPGNTGSPATLSVATLSATTDVDFRNITVTGAAAPISGTRLGDCLGNSGITFSAPRTVYWVSSTSGNWSGANWSTTSGNTGGTTTAFPLAQDFIVIDNAGLTAGGFITLDFGYNIPDLSFATRTNAVTFGNSAASGNYYGNITLGSGFFQSGTITQFLAAQSKTVTVTSAGKTFTTPLAIDAPLGTVRIADNLTMTQQFTLIRGTLDLTNNGAGNFTLTLLTFSSNNSNTRSINFGTGKIVSAANNTTIWSANDITGFTYTGTPRVELTYSGGTGTRSIQHGNAASGNEAGAVSFFVLDGDDTVSILADSHIKDLSLSIGGLSTVGTFLANTGNRTFYGNLSVSVFTTLGTNAACTTRFSSASATQTVSVINKTLGFAVVCDGANNTVDFSSSTVNSTAGFTISSGTVIFNSGSTSTFSSFTTTGTTPKFLRSSTPGSRAILSKSSGTVNVSYLSIKDTSATGGATWRAPISSNNIDAGNNIGWNFAAIGGFLAFFL